MSVWFYLFIGLCALVLCLMIKIFLMKREIINILASLAVILKSDTNQLITVQTNDHELKQLADSLNKSLRDLRTIKLEYENGNQQLKASITNISHDLRTPLTAIRGYLDFWDKEALNEKQRQYWKIIDQKVKDLTTLTEQLFDFSKSVDTQNEMTKQNVCLNHILTDTLAGFYTSLQQAGIEPQIEICEKKVYRFSNENMLKRIFENMISNALKYSEHDFHVKMDESGIITFSNYTKKLDQTSLGKIFDRYQTLNDTKKANGIGLSIAKQLVELCDGEIHATYEHQILTITIAFLSENHI